MDENNKDDVCPASLFLQIDYNNQFYRIDFICNIYWFMASNNTWLWTRLSELALLHWNLNHLSQYGDECNNMHMHGTGAFVCVCIYVLGVYFCFD